MYGMCQTCNFCFIGLYYLASFINSRGNWRRLSNSLRITKPCPLMHTCCYEVLDKPASNFEERKLKGTAGVNADCTQVMREHMFDYGETPFNEWSTECWIRAPKAQSLWHPASICSQKPPCASKMPVACECFACKWSHRVCNHFLVVDWACSVRYWACSVAWSMQCQVNEAPHTVAKTAEWINIVIWSKCVNYIYTIKFIKVGKCSELDNCICTFCLLGNAMFQNTRKW